MSTINNLIEEFQILRLRQNNTPQNTEIKEFLEKREWKYKNDINKMNLEIENIKNDIDIEIKMHIKDEILKHEIIYDDNSKKDNEGNIGPISDPIVYLKTKIPYFVDSIEQKTNLLLNLNIFKYRSISGDGNCFFRGVIFSFLENILLSNNIMLMKEFIILFDEKKNGTNPLKLNDNEYEKIENQRKQIIIILIIILDFMEKDNTTAYFFLIKAFLFEDYFDYGIIYFTRYLLCEYISENENKYYRKEDKDIEIGLLLPEKYIEDNNEQNNKYFFKIYYQEHLLKMDTFAESLEIYMVPYVFNCDLNIYTLNYYINNDQIELIEEVNNSLKCGINGANEINLLYNGIHYDIFYRQTFYEKYTALLNLFKNSVNSDIIINELKMKNELSKIYTNFLKKDDKKRFSISYIKNENDLLYEQIEKSKINIEEIIHQTKKNICLKCFKEIKNNKEYKQLPCGCILCNEKCFHDYLNKIKTEEKKEEEEEEEEEKAFDDGIYFEYIPYCRCGKVNRIKDIENIINGNKKNADNEKYKEIIQNHWKWKCMFHDLNFSRRYRYYRLIFEEKDPFTNKKLEHLVCFTCKKEKIDNNKDKKIKCDFCESEHIINKIKNVNEYNENESCLLL